MGSLSDYAENAMLDHVTNETPLSQATHLYVGLSTATIDDTTTGTSVTEPADTYARVETDSWDTAATRQTSNTSLITFAQAGASWGTITDWFIADAATLGNIIAYGTFGTSKSVVAGNTPSIAAGELDVIFSASAGGGGWTDVLVHEMLDHVFLTGAYTAPSLYGALYTVTPTDSTGGTECTGNNYARTSAYVGGWSAAAAGSTDNDAAISWPTPSGSWGTVVAAALCDASTVGNILLYDDVTNQEPNDGDTVEIPAGDFDITLA